MPPALLALAIAEWIVVCNFPHCGLRAVALPVALSTLPHSVTTAFVLPVVITTAQGEVLLDPDDLGPWLQPASRQIDADDFAAQRSVPDIRDIASKQCLGLPPVGAVVVEYFALRQLAGTEMAARSPTRIIVDAIRRIGDHQIGLRSRQHRLDIRRIRTIPAADPMISQQPYAAGLSNQVFG
jgi:hypothetical protein